MASQRYTVYFSPPGTKPREVWANSENGALKTALSAERLIGNRTRGLRATFAKIQEDRNDTSNQTS